jgi:hypothetical protein
MGNYRRNQLGEIDHKKGEHLINKYPPGFEKVNVTEGSSGAWSVRKFTVTADEVGLYNLRLIRDGQLRRVVPPGDYTKLICNGLGVVMSDTPAEAHESEPAYRAATGKVLINGLGLGFVLAAILRKSEVEHVTVIENSPDVIKLVMPSIQDNGTRCKVILADATVWRPAKGETFDAVWHDIWNDICEDNKPQMKAMKMAYRRKAKWQGCWSQEYL